MTPPPPEALEYLSPADRIAEQPLPRATRLTIHVLVLAIAAAAGWASLAEIDRVVTAQGRLVTTTSTIVAQPLETSVIRSIDVRPGDLVKRGQVLATFDPTFTESDVGQLESKRLSLEAQISRLEAELDGRGEYRPPTLGQNDLSGLESMTAVRLQQRLFAERRDYITARQKQFEQSLNRLEAKLVTNRQDQQVLKERAENIRQIQAMRQTLVAQQSGSRLQLLEARDMLLEVERLLTNAVNTEGEIVQERAAVASERASFLSDWRQKAAEELVTARRERDSVIEQFNKASRRYDLVRLTAQADGVVLEVAKRSVGSVAQPAEPLVTMVPADATLEAELQVEPRDVGLLRRGDAARIKLEAFPFQRHGTLPAKLRTISEDTLARKDQERGGSYYAARLEITDRTLRAVPEDTRLQPGLTLSAEIVVGRRTVLDYFLYPLIRAFDEAIREP